MGAVMRLEWTSNLETGVDAIDSDHRLIIEFYNRINEYYGSGADPFRLERAISDFKFLFTLHLLKEENFMMEIRYPDFESHAREHQTLVELLDKFVDAKGDRDESCQKVAFLVLQWLSSHLEGADRRLAAHAKGLLFARTVAAPAVGFKAHF